MASGVYLEMSFNGIKLMASVTRWIWLINSSTKSTMTKVNSGQQTNFVNLLMWPRERKNKLHNKI